MSHLLFLSHAGVDSEAALELVARIEASPVAREHDLKVWIDKRDLGAGIYWKDGLQEALKTSTAFVAYLGSRGVVNWVRDEVYVALDRVHAEPGYPLIPVLAQGASPESLPGFLGQFQGVLDSRTPEDLSKLLRAVLRLDSRGGLALERDPFLGLRAYESRMAHLFFGREQETEELLNRLRDERLVMVVGDSGSGKSSLVKAGVVPAFKGGQLARAEREGPDDTIWHVVETRPGSDPFVRLADDLLRTARQVNLSPKEASEVAEMVRQTKARAEGSPRNVDVIRDAFLATAPVNRDRCKILVVIDQFEELVTSPDAEDYVRAVLRLADPASDEIRVILTMRRDYYYLCATFKELYARLEDNGRRARYLLNRMSSAGLRECIIKPLQLAGVSDADRDDLAKMILNDVTDQPGELALVQMALWRAWSQRGQHDCNVLRAYSAIGRVEGALANAAQEVFGKLSLEDQLRAEVLFVRLVRPGESGVTRRIAKLNEFDAPTQTLARRLAEAEQQRLLTVGEETVEIAHEQLATQWLQYQQWIRNAPNDRRGDDLRVLHNLIHDSSNWNAAAEMDRGKHIATGHDLDTYRHLAERRKKWLSESEHSFVEASRKAHDDEIFRKREISRRLKRLTRASVAAALLAIGAACLGFYLWHLQRKAHGATLGSVAQLMLTQPVTQETSPIIAALAVTGWKLGRTSDAWDAMQRVPLLTQCGTLSGERDFDQVVQMIPTGDASRLVVLNGDGTMAVWLNDVLVKQSNAPIKLTLGSGTKTIALSPDSQIVASGEEGRVRLWKIENGSEIRQLILTGIVESLAFSGDGKFLAAAPKEGMTYLWRLENGANVLTLSNDAPAQALAVSKDGELVATGFGHDVRISSRANRWAAKSLFFQPAAMSFSADGRLLSISQDPGLTRIVETETGGALTELVSTGETTATLSSDGRFRVGVSESESERWLGYEVRITSIADGRESRITSENQFDKLGLSPNGKVIAILEEESSGGGSVSYLNFWKFDGGDRELARFSHDGKLGAISLSPDGTSLLVANTNGVVRVMNVNTGAETRRLTNGSPVIKAVLSAGGKLAATADSGGTTRLWELASGRELCRLTNSSPSAALAFIFNGAVLASAGEDGTLQTAGALKNTPLTQRTIAPDCFLGAFSPDGKLLVHVADNQGLCIVSVADGNEVRTCSDDDAEWDFDPPTSIALTPNGKWIALGHRGGDVRFLRSKDGKEAALVSHKGEVTALEFSADGKQLVTAAKDESARLLAVPSGRELARFQHGKGVIGLAFSAAGLIATAGNDGSIRLWSTDLDAMVGRLREGPGRNLSRTEWKHFGYLEAVPWRATFTEWENPP